MKKHILSILLTALVAGNSFPAKNNALVNKNTPATIGNKKVMDNPVEKKEQTAGMSTLKKSIIAATTFAVASMTALTAYLYKTNRLDLIKKIMTDNASRIKSLFTKETVENVKNTATDIKKAALEKVGVVKKVASEKADVLKKAVTNLKNTAIEKASNVKDFALEKFGSARDFLKNRFFATAVTK